MAYILKVRYSKPRLALPNTNVPFTVHLRLPGPLPTLSLRSKGCYRLILYPMSPSHQRTEEGALPFSSCHLRRGEHLFYCHVCAMSAHQLLLGQEYRGEVLPAAEVLLLRCYLQPYHGFYHSKFAVGSIQEYIISPWRCLTDKSTNSHTLLELNVPKREKYIVIAICSPGIITLISTLLRFPYLHQVNRSSDLSWTIVNIMIWSLAELGSAITLSCIPTIRPLYAQIFLKHAKKHSSHEKSGIYNKNIKQSKQSGVAPLPFTMGTIGSIVDRSHDEREGSDVQCQSKHQSQGGYGRQYSIYRAPCLQLEQAAVVRSRL